MLQLILHLLGDYVLQSDWMAQRKTKDTWAAFCHALTYSLPFLFIGSYLAVYVICLTHFFIDHFRLARYVVWAKNHLAPSCTVEEEVHLVPIFEKAEVLEMKVPKTIRWWHPWEACIGTGYHHTTAPWLAVWLLIACDNTLHLLINWLALRFL